MLQAHQPLRFTANGTVAHGQGPIPVTPRRELKNSMLVCANGSAATRTVQLVHIYIYHMYFGSRIKRLEKVRFPFRRYAAYGPSVIASNFAD